MISLHIVVDNAPPADLERAALYLKRTNQRTVDIAAGAQIDRGMQYVERVRAEVPGITVFWRDLDPDDTGMFTKMSVQEVYNRKVAPRRAWMQKNKIVYMPDNETSGDDNVIRQYVASEVQMAKLLHADGLHGAFCRFATGNIDDGGKHSNQYPLLKPIFDAMIPGDFISPNEYSAQPGYPPGSGGNLERYKLMWKVAKRRLPTVIGEAGVAMNYNPGLGYIDAGMTDEAYAQQIIDEQIFYVDPDGYEVDRHLYVVGAFSHAGYRLRNGVFEYLEKYYAHREPPVVITMPEIPQTPTQAPPVVIVDPPAPSTPAPAQESAWMSKLSNAERAMLETARLLEKYGDDMPTLCIEEGIYKFAAKLAAMLDAKD